MAAPKTIHDLRPAASVVFGASDAPEWRWARLARVVCLLLIDVAAISLAGAGAVLLWARTVLGQPLELYMELVPLIALLPLGYALAGLYPGFGLGAVEALRRLTMVTSLFFLAMAALVFVFKIPDLYSRMTFGLLWVGVLIFVPLTRTIILSKISHLTWWSEPCLVIAGPGGHRTLRQLLNGMQRVGYRPLGSATVDLEWRERVPHRWREAFVRDVVDPAIKRDIRVAIVDNDLAPHVLRDLQPHFRHVIALRGFADVDRPESRDLGGISGLEFCNQLLRRRNRVIKRCLDLVLSLAALPFAVPLIAVSAAWVKAASPGPAFFGQQRFGRAGQEITVWKIRTMVPDADRKLARMIEGDVEKRREWKDGFKLDDDPRTIPIVGKLLRRLSIDELPQLWNVFKGEMSLVGPRPLPGYHLDAFEAEARELRERVAPGITGLWQVRSWGSGSADIQHLHDEYYVRNWSVWLDIFILAKTIMTVLKGRAPTPPALRNG